MLPLKVLKAVSKMNFLHLLLLRMRLHTVHILILFTRLDAVILIAKFMVLVRVRCYISIVVLRKLGREGNGPRNLLAHARG